MTCNLNNVLESAWGAASRVSPQPCSQCVNNMGNRPMGMAFPMPAVTARLARSAAQVATDPCCTCITGLHRPRPAMPAPATPTIPTYPIHVRVLYSIVLGLELAPWVASRFVVLSALARPRTVLYKTVLLLLSFNKEHTNRSLISLTSHTYIWLTRRP